MSVESSPRNIREFLSLQSTGGNYLRQAAADANNTVLPFLASTVREVLRWFRKKERLNMFNSGYSSMVIKATPYKLQYSLFLQR